MADDWDVVAGPDVAPARYMSRDEFRASMDRVFGAGKWQETGGWRSPQREAALRQMGARTVPAGHATAHNLGNEAAPGAYDVTVAGLSPDAAAARMKAEGFPAAGYAPEGAAGGQGAHLHVNMAQDAHDPWGVVEGPGAWDAVSGPGSSGGGFWDQAKRKLGSAYGGAVEGLAKTAKGFAGWIDAVGESNAQVAAETGVLVGPAGEAIQLTPQQQRDLRAEVAANPHPQYATGQMAPAVKALQEHAAAVQPADRTPFESFLHGAGGFVTPLASAMVNPALGAVVFGSQGFGEAAEEAQAKGADVETQQTAGTQNALVMGGLGLVPVGKLVEPFAAGVKGLLGVGARYATTAAGDAALGATMQVGSNIVAQQNYDPERPWYDQVAQSAGMMALGGVVVHGAHDALGAGVRALRPAEAPAAPGEPPGAAPRPQDMPATNAIRAYAGLDPVEPAPPEPETASTWTPEREAKFQADMAAKRTPSGRQAEPVTPASPGDYVLFKSENGTLHGRVDGESTVDVNGVPVRMLDVRTAVGVVPVPARDTVKLPGDFEAARISEGAPLEQMPQAIADITELRRAAPRDYSLFQAIRDLGGIRMLTPEGEPTEVRDLLGAIRNAPPGTVNNRSGMAPDAMREALQQRGWFGEFDQTQAGAQPEARATAKPGDSIDELRDLIERQVGGQRVTHPSSETAEPRRAELTQQLDAAGVGATEALPQAAAKLAAWRGRWVRSQGPDMDLLKRRAEDLGVTVADGASYDEVLVDVLEAEARRDEATSADLDQYEALIDAQLTPEEHAWLAAGPRGADGELGPAFEPDPAPGRDLEPAEEEGAGQPGEGAGTGGQAAPPAEHPEEPAPEVEPLEALRTAADKMDKLLASARQVAIDKFNIKKDKTDPSKWSPEARDLFQRQYEENVRAQAKGNVPEDIAANDYNRDRMAADDAMKAFDFVDAFPPEIDRAGRPKATDLEDVKSIHDETARAVVQDLVDAHRLDEAIARGLDPLTDKPIVSAKRRKALADERYELSATIEDVLGTYETHFGAAARRRFERILRDRAWKELGGPSSGGAPPADRSASIPHGGDPEVRAAYDAMQAAGSDLRAGKIDGAQYEAITKRWQDAERAMVARSKAGAENPLEQVVVEQQERVAAATTDEERATALAGLVKARKTLRDWTARQESRAVPSERQNIGAETVDQTLLAGTERSARQAAKAREGPLRAKVAQEKPGGLFGAPEPEAGDLFAKDPWEAVEGAGAEREAPKDIAPTPEAKAAQREAEAPKGSGYGEKNTLFTKESADAARAVLARLGRQTNVGVDPELVQAGITLAGYHVEAGARLFGDYAAAMVRDLGEWSTPYLKMWYNALRDYPGFDAAGMTPHAKLTDAAVAEVLDDVRRGVPAVERGGQGGAAADAVGAQPLPAAPGEAERGLGRPGTGAAAAGLRTKGGAGLPDRGPAAVGAGGAGELFAQPPGGGADLPQRGQSGGGDVARDEGVQPDRIPAADLERASDEAAHLEPLAPGAHPYAESVDAPPVPAELDRDLPELFPEQRADVAFAEERFDAPQGHGVLFTNGTGTGKTYTGAGIAKRFFARGKKSILVLAPTQGILNQWRETFEHLGVPSHTLDGIDDAGRDVTMTTYANFGQNRRLAEREWDLIVPDEAHNLSSDQDGSETLALRALRAVSNHPDRLETKAEFLFRDEADKLEAERVALGKQWAGAAAEAYRERYDAFRAKVREKAAELAKLPRSKVAFLSATPFAYDKSTDWGEGFLFDYGPEPTSGAYNTPGSARDQFMIDHFGYRMRTGKLTKPEAAVESEVMERQFHEWLRRAGSLSGRVLTVDKDYDRKFATVDDTVGRRIDQALDFLQSADGGKFAPLAAAAWKQFNFLNRARLLEAIRARHVIPRIRAHLALGRKVVVFHNYNEGGGFNPFDEAIGNVIVDGDPAKGPALYREFVARNPYIEQLGQDLAGMRAPLVELKEAFPEALVYNGTVSKAAREQAKQAFNRDGGQHNIIIVQSAAGQAGISLHDTSGKHQRAMENLGMPGRPVEAIQQEGRIYRVGQASDAIFRYLTTGTNWERRTFAQTIAERAGTAENLALGNLARTLRQSFIDAYLDAAPNPPARGDGVGGKKIDFDTRKTLSDFEKAKSLFFAVQKKTARTKAREGVDYFATPEPLGLKMAQWADIQPGEKVLEPSAGHGAIARFFPETAERTLVEPSAELASRAGLNAPGAHVLEQRFEDLHAVNKYDAIVMNPPFGHAGATAIAHLEKAANHLREGGRIVALIPRGSTDAKFDKFMEGPVAKGLYEVGTVDLPPVTFERAGTQVRARIVILEKHDIAADRDRMRPTAQRDISGAGKIGELFDRLEDMTLPERVRPANAAPEALKTADQEAVEAAGSREPVFAKAQTLHGKTGAALYVATAEERMGSQAYKDTLALAKEHGGYYSAFRGKGAVPGFQFPTEAQRDAFVRDASGKIRFQRVPQGGPDLFAAMEPVAERPREGPYAKPAPDPKAEHFDQNHADLYRLGRKLGSAKQQATEAERLAREMGPYIEWTDADLSDAQRRHLDATGEPTASMMRDTAAEYAAAFHETGKQSFYDPDRYHDVIERWHQFQGGERPQFQRASGPVFYSAVERLVDNSPLNLASAEQWKATLANAPGVKKEEMEWLGVGDWLDLYGDAKVPKAALQQFIRDHGVKVEERVHGSQQPVDDAERDRIIQGFANDYEERARDRLERMGRDEADIDEIVHQELQDNWGNFEEKADVQLRPDTQYADWTLPGGADYHELLLTLPDIERPPATHWDTPGVMAHVRFDTREAPDGRKVLFVEEIQSDWHQKGRDQGYAGAGSAAERETVKQAAVQAAIDQDEAERAVVAIANELRTAIFKDEPPGATAWSGETSTSRAANSAAGWLESLAGIGTPSAEVAPLLQRAGRLTRDMQEKRLRVREANQKWENFDRGIPNAPFKTSWPALVMKRTIRWAVDNGFDRVAWTTGEQQAERYDLSKHVSAVRLRDNSSGGVGEADLAGPFEHGTVHIYGPEGTEVMQRHVEGEAGLRELVGADLAQRLLAAETKRGRYGGLGVRERYVGNLDTHIGGEGMKAFYDRNLVNITNDLVKKYGAKVEKGPVRTGDISEADYAAEIQRRENSLRDMEAVRRTVATPTARADLDRQILAARAALEGVRAGREKGLTDQHGFDITDKMREAASGGLPLFKRDGETVGRIGLGAHIQGDLYGVPADRDGPSRDIIHQVDQLLARIAPHAKARPFQRLTDMGLGEGFAVAGATYRRGAQRVIGYALEVSGKPDPASRVMHTGAHEAIHALRQSGFITPGEWRTLETAAVDRDWMAKHDIPGRYADVGWEQELEEAIAEEFADWRAGMANVPQLVRPLFEAMKKLFDAVAGRVRAALGRQSAHDIFRAIESGEVGSRARQGPRPTRQGLSFARRPVAEEDEAPPVRGVRAVFTRLLGRDADAVGHRIARVAERAVPDPLLDLADDLKMGLSPMGSGSSRAQAAAKDFANELRRAAFQWGQVDEWLAKRFTPDRRQAMWAAADEHGVMLRRSHVPGPDEGMNRLSDPERAAVEELQQRADDAFARAKRLDMVSGEGLESYVPRMVVTMTAAGPRILAKASRRAEGRGGNLSTTTGQLRQRKYETVEETEAAAKEAFGKGAMVVRDIRTLALGTQRLEQAIAGRVLVDKIKRMSADAGADTVVSDPADTAHYFTLDHPAMSRWRPKFNTDADGKVTPAVDQNGETVFERQPLWISKEFEGPLKAVLTKPTSGVIRALTELKGKMMSVIMYSPLMHNAVIWGKAIPADPRGVLTFEAYRRGNAAKRDRATMDEALGAGLDPIGKRYFNQDITAIAEAPQIVPGRSWTSQLLGYVPGLFDPAAGEAVKRSVDALGDLWHNTFLWDRVADLQMGLYVHIRDGLLRQGNQTGMRPKEAQRIAAHFANRYAGSLPLESMSKLSREMANLMLFSRSFTLGNMAAYKDILKGLPSDVRSQILEEAGPEGLERAQGVARQKAVGMLALDVGLSYVGLFLAAAATAFLTHQTFQPPWDNEPERRKRFLIGYQPDGTAIYGRLPTGKVGEELQDWATEPRDILLRKLSPYGRVMYALAANDKGFGRKLFLEGDPLWKNTARVAWFTLQGVAPVGQLQGMSDAFTGAQDRRTAALQALAPIAGVTISKGAPGGPAMADYYAAKDRHDFAVQEAMPDIRRQITRGDIAGARAAMTRLGIAPSLQNYYVKVARAPGARLGKRAMGDFARFATPEEKAQLAKDRAAARARAAQP